MRSRYKNSVWKFHYGRNDLLLQPYPDEDTLEELFLKVDRIGNKYQTPEEIKAFNQKLSAEANAIAAVIDQQFPEPEGEFIDYSKIKNKQKPTTKRQRR